MSRAEQNRKMVADAINMARDVDRAAFSWLSTKKVCQQHSAAYAAKGV